MIHLGQALARMREYERVKMAPESNLDSEDGCSNNPQIASASKLEGMGICIHSSGTIMSHSFQRTS